MTPCSLVDVCRSFGGLDASVLTVDETSILIDRFISSSRKFQVTLSRRSEVTFLFNTLRCCRLLTLLSVELIKLYSSLGEVSAFRLAKRSSQPNMGSALHYCAYFHFNPSSIPPKGQGELSCHSHLPVSGLLIVICSAMGYILNYRFDSGQFCYSRHFNYAFIYYTP